MLPKAVEEANRRAEELHRQVYGNPDQPPQDEAVAAPQQEEPKAEEKPAEPAPQQESKPETKPDPKEGDPDYWKRRFDVVQGKYSVEIPRMAAEIRSLKGQLNEALAKANNPPAPPTSKLKPEEVEEYGEKFIDVVKRAAAEVVPEDVGEMKQTVERLKGETLRLSKDRFFSDLTRQAPQWESLNEDRDFLTWLAGIDPFTGQNRQDLFDQATAQMDAWRVANFFNSYGSEQPAAESEPDPVAQQVEPPASRVSAPPPGKKIWTTEEIGRFYADVRSRRLNPEDQRRIEADIFAAQTEGRIR
jgi:hypothetical protein